MGTEFDEAPIDRAVVPDLQPGEAWSCPPVRPGHTPRIKNTAMAARGIGLVPRHVGMAVQKDIPALPLALMPWVIGWNVLEPEAKAETLQVQSNGPFHDGITVATDHGQRPLIRIDFRENPGTADIAEVPDLRCPIQNLGKDGLKTVMGIRENGDAQHFVFA